MPGRCSELIFWVISLKYAINFDHTIVKKSIMRATVRERQEEALVRRRWLV